ncbi:MAG: hypothetical protein K2Q07_02055 [Burkholderiaceae bacterium]|nr:hypothetical protein [Burkholderiaceae bacterium]
MVTPPLTHHEILALVAPFTARGRHVDLAASDRAERRLVFKRIHHAAQADGSTALHETLVLENGTAQAFRLTRRLSLPGGLDATLHTEGRDPGELLARIEAIALRRQIRWQSGFVIAEHHRLDASEPAGRDAAATRMILTHATAQIGALTVELTLPALGGIPAELALKMATERLAWWPEDLLAVLGWSWARLIRAGAGWKCSLRVRGKREARSRDAEQKFEQTAAHLVQTLAESPLRFHERWSARRWGVTVRRAIPLLVTVSLIATAAAVPSMGLSEDSLWRMVVFQSPPLLLVLVFCFRELPQIEIPPWPRALTQPHWFTTPAAADTGQPSAPSSATTP